LKDIDRYPYWYIMNPFPVLASLLPALLPTIPLN
jgi:hypothetical protein